MNYRRLGSAGLQVSELSFGAWVTFGQQIGEAQARELMTAAYEAGINFFDNAESYAAGNAEIVMGNVFKKTGWRRESYVVSTKFFWGLNDGANQRNTLNRKYLAHAIDGSLKRFQLDHIDLVFCHRPDPHTPIEETVWAMSDMVRQGKALYWGTSEWSADQILQAWHIADRHHLPKPQMEQPQYHLLHRDSVEKDLARLYKEIGLGLTTWSPLASGLLSGKYSQGIPDDARANLKGYEWLRDIITQPERIEKVKKLHPIAADLGCSMAQMAIAWCVKNPNVSTVILGASKVEQLKENLKALDVVEKLTPDVLKRIEETVG